jgi:hypothetical protein
VRIDAVVICQDARTRDGMIDLLGVGVDTYEFPSFPAGLRVPMYIRVAGEPGESADLLVQTFDVVGALQSETLQPFEVGARDANLPAGCPVAGVKVVRYGVALADPGTYVIRVSIAGGDPVTHVVYLKQA